VLQHKAPSLEDGSMQRIRPLANVHERGIVPKPGHEAEVTALWNAYQTNWATVIAEIGDGIAFDLEAVANHAGISEARAAAVLNFFTLQPATIPVDFYIPIPDSTLKLRPLIKFDKRWTLPSSMLFLPAMQPAIERALNPALHAPTADKDAWVTYETHRGDFLEERTMAALSRLLCGAQIHRNLKYKTMPGQKSPFELDGLVLHDGKLLLIECKGGAFSSAARRGDLDAIEDRIDALITDAHEQAVRALEYIESVDKPLFRVDDKLIDFDKGAVEEVFLITTTLEELGFLSARFNEVSRLPTTSLRQTPWTVPVHDLELVAKYITTAPIFIHYLGRRIALNAQKAMGAFDEMDWLGRYFFDGLTLADVQRVLAADPTATASLASHKTEIDDFEHYERGIREKPAGRPGPRIHRGIERIIDSLTRWAGRGYIDAGVALLNLPPKLQRAFAKRVLSACEKVSKVVYVQELALSEDGELAYLITVLGAGANTDQIVPHAKFGNAKRSIHLFVDALMNVLALSR